ncbi:thyroid receptor-interacting protein 11 [Pungitius pungitius]|uniref:thyroid receptor-interacting protein 11 n=1 Tax=Pungitius pungitius TaxID=134920 RepID=UPI002E1133F0
MSSWLGGIGSGLGQSLGQVGGSLSSFTGQISNFTKDMLLEGVEEVGDAATELQVSNNKLADIESALTSQKSEYDRIRKLNAELEEKLEASEIQIKGQSAEYRSLLQQKDVEISHLKARQSGLMEEVQNLPAMLPVTTSASTATSSSISSYMSQPSGSHQGFHGDEMDLSDVIWSQQEINRLSAEVMRLEAEAAHWRRMSQASTAAAAGNGDQGEVLKLQRTIKELREEMSREVDEHQHELAALQDAQRQKLADITRRHREDLAEYEERIEELEDKNHSGGPSTSPSDASKVQQLQKAISSLQETADQREKQLAELSAGLEEAQAKQASLQLEKDEVQEENTELLQNYTRLQASVTELQTRVQEQEGKSLQKAQLDHEIQVLRKSLAAAEKEIEGLKSMAGAESKEEVEHADILELNTIIETLRQEKEVLEQEKLSIQEQRVSNDAAESGDTESLEDLKAELERRDNALRNMEEERDTLMSELEELDRQNQEATQHMISVKEQLSGQLREAEAELTGLTAELNTTKDQKRTLEQELESQKEKASQSAFTLNDLHMGKQELELRVKDLKDKLGHAQEQSREARREITELKSTLEEQFSFAKTQLDQSRERGSEAQGTEEKLAGKEGELSELRRELDEIRSSHNKALSEDYELKMENRRLKVETEQAVGNAEELAKQIKESQAALNRTLREKETRIEALKLEKSQLEGELEQAERTLAEQGKQFQQTIEELTRARSLDASALQTEHERAIKLNQEKDMEIAQLKRDVEQVASDHRDTNEMLSITVAGQKQLTDLLQEKDVFVDTLKQNALDLQKEMEDSILVLTKESDALKQALEEKDKQLGCMKEKNSHLKEEIDRLRDQQSRPQPLSEPRTLDIITELETEITQLRSSRNCLEEEVQTLRRTMEELQASLLLSQQSLQAQQTELEQTHARHQQTTLNYDRLIHARDEEISSLQRTVDQLSGSRVRDSPPVQGEVILQEEKTQTLSQENGNEKHDLSKVDIERLVRGIKEKETEISLLNEKNLSLTRQLDQLVVSRDEVGKLSQMILQKDLEIQALHARMSLVGGGGHSQDVMFLQQQLQAYAVEREQVLGVLNEKTRENSQLRSDYHRLMDIMAGKEAALSKLQQENQRLSNMSDPSGSQEMFKETIQNLSRIIREKDIEIDALTQKCQTLVTVLQSSAGESGGGSGGVSSNQFEELLQERDTLKQQVKKMEEWKQQVITTVKNMQHESAQLQEELIKLQGQVSADSDCSSKLSVDYAGLIQSYERKESRLGSLSQELAQVQQTITQLSTTKDVLLVKLDSVAQAPEVAGAPATGASLAAAPVDQTSQGLNHEKLREEIVQLRIELAEKENAIKTLQENNHRLSNAASATESEQRSQAGEARLVRERLEALQRSVREKDLLIKTKGDQLSHVSETLRNRESDNEVLKQAVTNLKERALILEMDGKKLKEENELVASRSREKESEFRALQETNMQVSLLLREKEFELSAVSEKSATVERMLKDKEQGKSGELNQLLNELKSMQEKAFAFQQERDQMMMALKQKQMETTAVHTELQHVRDKEQRLNLELDRLRNHLMEIEDSYTREAVSAEDRETELRRRVALLEEKLATSSSAVENASQQASMQVESLQEQLTGVVKQRDETLIRLRTSQEQVNQYAVSLSNLQMVLEQFQQEEKAMYSAELDMYKKERDEWKRKALRLEDQASALQINLDEANAALESASRLTDQLDLNEEQIQELKHQVEIRQEMLEEAQKKLMNLLNSTEGKIDKVLMRNLFLGYFHTPKTKRADVLRLMGSVLGLSREDVDKMLGEDGGHGVTGWVSSWLGGRGAQSVPNTPQRPTSGQGLNSSFSEMFVKFLEIESTPSLPAAKLPAHDIKALGAPPPRRTGSASGAAGGAALAKRPGESNPFLAPRSAAVPLVAGSSSGGSGSHLLMKPICEALPTFTPVPVSSEASAGSVLKDLLKQ